MDAHYTETLMQNISSLPQIERSNPNAYILDNEEATLAWRAMQRQSSAIVDHQFVQIRNLEDEIIDELPTTEDGNRFFITKTQLHGILARMAIRSTAQNLNDIGDVLHQAQKLEELFLLDTEENK